MPSKFNTPGSHGLSGFFLLVTMFIIALSILAICTTIVATEYSIEKDDLQVSSLAHLTKAIDWLNDYNEEKIGERILKAQLDSLDIGLLGAPNISNKTDQISQNIDNYKSHINLLDADEKTNGSLLNLKYNADIENNKYLTSLVDISHVSKILITYELVTILLIIGTGLGGMSEIARNKLIGYPAFLIGAIGIIILILVIFYPSAIMGPHTTLH
jgi:hypothetical protein